MARKKKEKGVTLSFQDLITQPRQLAQLPMMNKMAGYRVLIAVLQRLQGLWRIAKIPENKKNGQLYMNFVTDEFEVKRKKEGVYNEGDVVFKLRLSDIALDSHYDEARKALAEITHIKCFIPDHDNPGYYRTGSLMEVRGRREAGQFVGTEFEVIVPNLTAENILDINLFSNYTRFVGYTAGRLRSSFSYPLYIYLSEEWRHHGDQFMISMKDLRTRLGFVKNDEDPERENRYATWSQFCQKVLDQAKKELSTLAQVGGADFTFEYQGMLYGQPLPKFKRPDAVAFTILPTKVGEELQQFNDYTPNREAAKQMMTDFYKLTAGQTHKLLRRVSPSFMPTFLSQLTTWKMEIESGARTGINNRPGWAYKSIDELIRAEERKTIKAAEENRQVQTEETQQEGDISVEEAKNMAQEALKDKGTPAYDYSGARLTPTKEEQRMLDNWKTDMQNQYSASSPSFVRDIVSRIEIMRVRNNNLITFTLSDGSHITPERINHYEEALYPQFIALFHIHFPNYRCHFD